MHGGHDGFNVAIDHARVVLVFRCEVFSECNN